jgi:drug/metabolite transporter (DMT)-like permease
MDNLLVAAALASAVLHAAWNAAVKASADPAQAMTAQMVGSALCALPLLALTGLPAAAALPWMLGSMLLNIGTAACMLRGYQHAGFGIVYPMVRASSVQATSPARPSSRMKMATVRMSGVKSMSVLRSKRQRVFRL